jgi:hypothetical protein
MSVHLTERTCRKFGFHGVVSSFRSDFATPEISTSPRFDVDHVADLDGVLELPQRKDGCSSSNRRCCRHRVLVGSLPGCCIFGEVAEVIPADGHDLRRVEFVPF